MTEETERVLNLIASTEDRIELVTEREAVIKLFIQLMKIEKDGEKVISVQKLAQMLDFFFDFRNLNNPKKGIKVQSLVTEIHNIVRKEGEKKENY